MFLKFFRITEAYILQFMRDIYIANNQQVRLTRNMTKILIFAIVIYLINIPFGFWRAGTQRFTLSWYLAIHIPVPAIILLRVYYDLGWTWQSYTILVAAFFFGQLTGQLIRKNKISKSSVKNISSTKRVN